MFGLTATAKEAMGVRNTVRARLQHVLPHGSTKMCTYGTISGSKPFHIRPESSDLVVSMDPWLSHLPIFVGLTVEMMFCCTHCTAEEPWNNRAGTSHHNDIYGSPPGHCSPNPNFKKRTGDPVRGRTHCPGSSCPNQHPYLEEKIFNHEVSV